MPLTIEQLLNSLSKYNLLAEGELSSIRAGLGETSPSDSADALAQDLVKQGKLTKFQLLNLEQGRGKGLIFGEYVVLDKLGAGGMGQVYKAQHRRMKRVVALKVLPPSAVASPKAVQRFYQEVEVAAKLAHPNIVVAHDAGEANGLHYLVMEYVEGRDLSSYINKHGPLGVEQAANVILQAARGLAYAHSLGIIHRDIKPSNLLVARQGQVKILDMGLARFDNPLADPTTPAQNELTASGEVMGTVDYMAPEQASDTRTADHRADIYALGCTLHRLLTGNPPYVGDTMIQKILAHREQPIPSLTAQRSDVPEVLDRIYQKMMAKNPAQRTPAMSQVVSALEQLLSGVSEEKSSVVLGDDLQPAKSFDSKLLPPAVGTSGVLSAAAGGSQVGGSKVGGSNLGAGRPGGSSVGGVKPAARTAPAVPVAAAIPRAIPTAKRLEESPPAAAVPKAGLSRGMLIGGGAGAAAIVAAVLFFVLRSKEEPAQASGEVAAASNPPAAAAPDVVATPSPTAEPIATAEPPLAMPSFPTLPAIASATASPGTAFGFGTPTAVSSMPQPSGTAVAAFPPEGVDLLKQLDLQRDVGEGQWQRDGNDLISTADNTAGRIQFPVAPPAEYDLHVDLQLTNGSKAVIGLVTGLSQAGFHLSFAAKKGTGLGDIDRADYFTKGNGTFQNNPMGFEADTPMSVVCRVRATGVSVALNDRPVVDWTGELTRLSAISKIAGTDRTKLFLYAAGAIRFFRYEVVPPGVTPRSAPVLRKDGLDLLATVDLKRDVGQGAFLRDTSGLVSEQGTNLLQFAQSPPAEYDLHIGLTTLNDRTAATIGLVVGPARVGFVMSHLQRGTGLSELKGLRHYMKENPTHVYDAFGFVPGRPQKVICRVRTGAITVMLNDRKVVDWQGDTADLKLSNAGPDPTKLVLIASNELRITQYELLPPGGTPRSTAAVEVDLASLPKHPGVRVDLLKQVDLARDTAGGTWKLDGTALVETGGRGGARLQFPYDPPDAYELRITAVPTDANSNVLIAGFVVGASPTLFTISNGVSGLDTLDGGRYNANETTVGDLSGLGAGIPVKLVCRVWPNVVNIHLNGRQVVNWVGDSKRLGAVSSWALPDPTKLGIGCTNYRILQCDIARLTDGVEQPPATTLLAATTAKIKELSGNLPANAQATQKTYAAERLHREAAATDDSALRYACLAEAAKLAAAADDVALLSYVLEDWRRCFEINAVAEFDKALAEIANRTRPVKERAELVAKLTAAARQRSSDEQFDLAVPLAKTASAVAARTTDNELKKETRYAEQEAEEYAKLFAAAEAARPVLATNAGDGAANLAVGTYLAVAQGEWTAALPHLAKASEPTIAAAAQMELQSGADLARAADVGAAWIEAADKASLGPKAVFFDRAKQRFADGAAALKATVTPKMQTRFKKVEGDVQRTAGTAFVKRHPPTAAAFGGHWYQCFPEALTWDQARERCREMGGYLACIETSAENQWVIQYALAQSQNAKTDTVNFWLGGSKVGHDAVFTWVNGSPLQFADWHANEPDPNTADQNIVLWQSAGKTKWSDAPGTSRYYFICEWDR